VISDEVFSDKEPAGRGNFMLNSNMNPRSGNLQGRTAVSDSLQSVIAELAGSKRSSVLDR
jgi:hypothetical protein